MLVSYAIRSKDGRIIDGESHEIPLPPASNMKIPSTYYAYKILGKERTLKTLFRIDQEFLNIYGDPLFLFSKGEFKSLLSDYLGDLKFVYYDKNMLWDEKYHPDWMIGDKEYCYGAPVEPYTIDENCIGGYHKGEHSKGSLLEREFKLIRKESKNTNSKDGNYSIISREIKLKDVICHILSISCNFSAELLLRYSSQQENDEKNWIGAANNVSKFLINMGLDSSQFEIRDGSGLSRVNLFTASELSNLMFKIFTYDREFVYYLPGPGKGTLSNRLDDIKDYEIYAKTGTIRYISSLTGVSLSRELAFSFIAYGKEPTEKREEAIDKLLSKILFKI